MVASGSLFLLCLSASSYHCRNGSSNDVRRHATPLFGVKPSSACSGPRREDRITRSLSAPSTESEGQIDDGVNILTSDIRQLRWEGNYMLLKRFKEREGHCNVAQSHTENGANLGKWVANQRQVKKTGALDPARKKRLEEIDIEWVLGEKRANVPWEDIFSLLKQFKMREGHCNVPQSHTEDGANLGAWASRQRQLKTTEKLDPDRDRRLGEIGFDWGTSTTWEEMYALLKQFKKREGHCNVPCSHTEDGANLGMWASRQRQRERKGKLGPDREERLKEIGFECGTSATWDKMYALLQQFKKREGHCNVPQSHTEEGTNLGTWASHQRQLKRKEKIDADRKTRLEEIGFEWATSAAWDEMYALLKKFNIREGHCIVPTSHEEYGSNLGTWLSFQRHLEKIGKLDPNRQKLLDDFGFKRVRQAKAP